MARSAKNIDGGWAWVILTCGFFCMFLNGFMCYSVGVIAEALLEEFDGDLASTAAVGTSIIGIENLLGPFIGIGINVVGCRLCTIFGGVFAMFGFVGASMSRNLSVMMGTFGILSVSMFLLSSILIMLIPLVQRVDKHQIPNINQDVTVTVEEAVDEGSKFLTDQDDTIPSYKR